MSVGVGFILCLGIIAFLVVRCYKDKRNQKLCTQAYEKRASVAIQHNIPSEESLQVLNVLRDLIAENATAKGFRAKFAEGLTKKQWKGPPGQLIRASVYTANQHGEASEFWEAFRKGTLKDPCDKATKMEALGLQSLTCAEEEIADELIRVLDKAECFGIDVAKAVITKMSYNATRPALHGGKKA